MNNGQAIRLMDEKINEGWKQNLEIMEKYWPRSCGRKLGKEKSEIETMEDNGEH